MDTPIVSPKQNKPKSCVVCGKTFYNQSTDICRACEIKGSKKKCPIEGCDVLINPRASTCLNHRHLFVNRVHESCVECGKTFEKATANPVCKECAAALFVQCACGCGHYRRKYNKNGQEISYISGHNDNWAGKEIPNRACAYCGKTFQPAYRKTRLCSNDCRRQWLKLNPPGKTQKVLVKCCICGQETYKRETDLRNNPDVTCSRECQYEAMAQKLRGPKTSGKALALLRDDKKCKICGFDVVVHVHHIDPKRKGGKNSPDNLITLCPNHHAMADRGLIPPNELLGLIRDDT